jgi:hypothetical protein
MSRNKFDAEKAKRAIVRVGGGRGFIVEASWRLPVTQVPVPDLDGHGNVISSSHVDIIKPAIRRERLIVTAAHCLQNLPPAHGMSYVKERTYGNVLGPLGAKKASIWAECVFADPVSDLAVLAGPDNQELGDESDAYDELTGAAAVLPVADQTEGRAWMLSLRGNWFPCTVETVGDFPFWITLARESIDAGMSGSPILSCTGDAIGVVCLTANAPVPRLAINLPGRLLRQLGLVKRPRAARPAARRK